MIQLRGQGIEKIYYPVKAILCNIFSKDYIKKKISQIQNQKGQQEQLLRVFKC